MMHNILKIYNLEKFTLRVLITFLILSITQISIFNYFEYKINDEKSYKIKNYLKGIIQNPEVFYINAENLYKDKKFLKAKIEINYALGLINYHCDLHNKKICLLDKKISESISLHSK